MSFTVSKTFVDTNVLAYLFDTRAPQKRARAREVLEGGSNLVISSQVMLELHAVLTRKFEPPLTRDQAERVLTALDGFEVVPADAALVRRAAAIAVRHELSIWDAMILAAAEQSGCDELLTDDLDHGATLVGVRIVNPFAA